MNKVTARFVWNKTEQSKSKHWVSWKRITTPLDEGGLGFRDFRELAEAFKIKSCWQILTGDTIWADFMKAKYMAHPNFWDINNWKVKTRCQGNLKPYVHVLKDNSLLLLGNGNKGNIWDDNWLGSGPIRDGMNISQYPISKISILKDIELAYNTTMQGSLDLLLCETGNEVTIPPDIKFCNAEDKWVWKLNNNGAFSVSSAWQYIRHSLPSNSFCKNIWRSKAPGECKLFCWKLCHRALPTDNRIKEIGIQLVSRCALCKEDEESMHHILISCRYAHSLWMNLSKQLCFNIVAEESICTRINRIFRGHHKDDAFSFIITVCSMITPWVLWKERCNRVFEEVFSPAEVLFQIIINLIRSLTLIHEKKQPGNIFKASIISEFDFYQTIKPCRPMKFVKWYPPDFNKLKLNTDGASRGNPGNAGGGFILRNQGGKVLVCGSSYYGICSSVKAEMRAILDGLNMIKNFGLLSEDISIEIDSLAVANILRSSTCHWSCWYYWHAIKPFLREYNISLVHIYREANTAADYLANHGITNSICTYYPDYSLLPKELKGILRVDALGFGSFRL